MIFTAIVLFGLGIAIWGAYGFIRIAREPNPYAGACAKYEWELELWRGYTREERRVALREFEEKWYEPNID